MAGIAGGGSKCRTAELLQHQPEKKSQHQPEKEAPGHELFHLATGIRIPGWSAGYRAPGKNSRAQITIMRCCRDFEGVAWAQYDRVYRRQAALSKDLNWSRICAKTNQENCSDHTANHNSIIISASPE